MSVIDSGEVIHEGRYCRVVYHEGRQQPAAFWVWENARWALVRFFDNSWDAIAYARRYEGENV